MSSKPEFRVTIKELRATGNTEMPCIKGYAAVFNSQSVDLGGFVEVIKPGAFTRCLQNSPDVRALLNHESNAILGRTTSGTLRLRQDSVGLHCEIDLPNTSVGRDVYESVKRGDISQMSFGFYPVDEDWMPNPSGTPAMLREISDADVFDVSVVTYPAYQGTSVSARSLWPEGKPEGIEMRTTGKSTAKPKLSKAEREQMSRRVELSKL
jgi:Escherichia/Staphylococcus phage prohead protease